MYKQITTIKCFCMPWLLTSAWILLCMYPGHSPPYMRGWKGCSSWTFFLWPYLGKEVGRRYVCNSLPRFFFSHPCIKNNCYPLSSWQFQVQMIAPLAGEALVHPTTHPNQLAIDYILIYYRETGREQSIDVSE